MPSEPLMDDTFNLLNLTKELTQDEGRLNYPYVDTLGFISIGVGHNLAQTGLREDEIDLIFHNDVAYCCTVMDKEIFWWRSLPPSKQRVMLNLCFMGWEHFKGFHHFLAAMRVGDWILAAKEIENSKWYVQVKSRGPRVVARLLAPDDAEEVGA